MTNLSPEQFALEVRTILSDLENMLVAKNIAYGDASLTPVRVFAKSDNTELIKVRIDDKLSRIRSGNNDEDTVLDLMGYLVLLRIASK